MGAGGAEAAGTAGGSSRCGGGGWLQAFNQALGEVGEVQELVVVHAIIPVNEGREVIRTGRISTRSTGCQCLPSHASVDLSPQTGREHQEDTGFLQILVLIVNMSHNLTEAVNNVSLDESGEGIARHDSSIIRVSGLHEITETAGGGWCVDIRGEKQLKGVNQRLTLPCNRSLVDHVVLDQSAGMFAGNRMHHKGAQGICDITWKLGYQLARS